MVSHKGGYKAHPAVLYQYLPVQFLPQLDQLRITPTAALSSARNGDRIKVAGLVLVRQRPGTAKGVLFMTIEDETGVANAVIWDSIFDQYRKEILGSKLIMLEGKLHVEGLVIHIVVQKCYNLTRMLKKINNGSPAEEPQVSTLARADETSIPQHAQKHVFFKGRNFR
jgi:error-prone DNA polymerase